MSLDFPTGCERTGGDGRPTVIAMFWIDRFPEQSLNVNPVWFAELVAMHHWEFLLVELDQHMFSIEVVVVDCKMFVEQLLVPRSCPVLLLESYKMFVKELLELHNCPVLLQLVVEVVLVCKMFLEELQVLHNCPALLQLVVEVVVVCKMFEEELQGLHNCPVLALLEDCKMFVEVLLELHKSQVELRKQMRVASCKMFVELDLVLCRSSAQLGGGEIGVLYRSSVEQGGGEPGERHS